MIATIEKQIAELERQCRELESEGDDAFIVLNVRDKQKEIGRLRKLLEQGPPERKLKPSEQCSNPGCRFPREPKHKRCARCISQSRESSRRHRAKRQAGG